MFETIPDLKPYVGESGFASLRDWRKAIMSTYKSSMYIPRGWLYKVMIVDTKQS